MNRYLITLIALGLLTGCVTAPPPPLTADDPANPSAPEAPAGVIPNALSTDGLSRKTHQILAQSTKERQKSNQGDSDAGDQNGEKMKNMPDMQSHRQQQLSHGPSQTSPLQTTN